MTTYTHYKVSRHSDSGDKLLVILKRMLLDPYTFQDSEVSVYNDGRSIVVSGKTVDFMLTYAIPEKIIITIEDRILKRLERTSATFEPYETSEREPDDLVNLILERFGERVGIPYPSLPVEEIKQDTRNSHLEKISECADRWRDYCELIYKLNNVKLFKY